MRTFLPRVMLAAVAATVVLPAVFTPAQAAPWSLSSSSSSSLGGSSLSSIFEELTDEEIVVDLPGYGEYRFPADLTLASLNPDNADPVDLFSAAVFAADYEDNADARQAALAALQMVLALWLTAFGANVIGDVLMIAAAALTALHGEVALPETASARAPIVVLGNGLNPDGSLHPNLENRLLAATELAKRRPGAPIVVSGGPLVGGYVEAHAMRDWAGGRGSGRRAHPGGGPVIFHGEQRTLHAGAIAGGHGRDRGDVPGSRPPRRRGFHARLRPGRPGGRRRCAQ